MEEQQIDEMRQDLTLEHGILEYRSTGIFRYKGI